MQKRGYTRETRPTHEIEAELFALRRQRQQISERTRQLGEVLYKRRATGYRPPEQRQSYREIMGY